jgi:hypothetical protein
MIVFLHGFDWATYTDVVMPAFARWLLERDESAVAALFEQTRCAQEEESLPAPMQRLRSWTRARAFVQKLPRGLHSLEEYEQLCSPEAFTQLSDRYLHLHTPRLYQQNDALRTVWGAILETYCLPWRDKALDGELSLFTTTPNGAWPEEPGEGMPEIREELISLLHSAGLADLADQISSITHLGQEPIDSNTLPDMLDASGESRSTGALPANLTGTLRELGLTGETTASGKTEALSFDQGGERDTFDLAGAGMNETATPDKPDGTQFDIPAEASGTQFISPDEDGEDENELAFTTQAGGVEIGGMVDLLHLRGWLARVSLRAMALFEYLACGRRCMPFGYVVGEPYNYVGYLTPGEVQQLASCLRNVSPPTRGAVARDQLRFRQQQNIPVTSEYFRMVDEVLPAWADEFLQAVHAACTENLGLICAIE